jgi:hypothetical protein
MTEENKIRDRLLSRGFSRKTLLNNRGLIGAVIEETFMVLTEIENIKTYKDVIEYLGEDGICDGILLDMEVNLSICAFLKKHKKKIKFEVRK